jgi:hypothetical protein
MKQLINLVVLLLLIPTSSIAQDTIKSDLAKNIITISCSMKEPLDSVFNELLCSKITTDTNSNILTVIYSCHDHKIELYFYNNLLIGGVILYQTDVQFKEIIELFDQKLYRLKDDNYNWVFYYKESCSFIILHVDKDKKTVQIYLDQ